MKKYILSVLVAVLLVGGVALADNVVNYFYDNSTYQEANNVNDTFGANPGPDKYQRQYFHAGFNDGGTRYATTTVTAGTIKESDIDEDVKYIQALVNVDTTLTFPATGTMVSMLGKEVGDTRTYIIHNASTTAASALTIAAGTGVDLQEDEGETVILNGLEFGRITFMRTGLGAAGGSTLSGGNGVVMIVEPFQVGD